MPKVTQPMPPLGFSEQRLRSDRSFSHRVSEDWSPDICLNMHKQSRMARAVELLATPIGCALFAEWTNVAAVGGRSIQLARIGAVDVSQCQRLGG